MPRPYHRRKQRYSCPQCGLLVLNHLSPSHAKGVYHRYPKKVRTLLATDCPNFAEVARRLGVTRQYVSQIAAQIGIPKGRKTWTPEQRKAQALERNPLLAELVQEAEKHGLRPELVRAKRKRKGGPYLRREIQIGKSRCGIKKLFHTYRDLYYLSRPSQRHWDFVLGKLPSGWMVIPRKKFPKRSTGFIVGREKRTSGARSHRHDWPHYLNAWDLLHDS